MDTKECSSEVKTTVNSNTPSGDSVSTLNCSKEKKMKKDDSGINVDKDCNSSEDDIDSVAMRTTSDTSVSINTQKTDLNSPDSGNPEINSLGEEPQSSAPEVLDTVKRDCDNDENKFSDCDKVTKSLNCDKEKISSCDDDKKNVFCEDKKKSSVDDKNREKYDPTPKNERPRHKWTAPLAMLNRQYGTSVKYSPDLFRYACYGSLHMVERLELMYKMKGHEGCVNTLHFNASGTKLASGSDDLGIIIWDWPTSDIFLEFSTGHRSNVFQAKFLPLCGDSQIVSCARDGQVRIAELSVTGTCNQSRKLAQHKGSAHKLAIQNDSPYSFLSCGEDSAVFEIDVRINGFEKLVMCKDNQKKVPLYSIHINPNKPYEYVTGGRNQFVRVFDRRFPTDSGFVRKFCPEALEHSESKANVTSVVYNYNGTEILASYNDDDIYLFDAESDKSSTYLHRYAGHRNSQTVKGVNFFGPKSEFIVSGSDCGYIFFWEKHSEHIVQYMHGDEGGVVNCLEPNPNMPVLASSGLDDDIKIWVPSCEVSPDLSELRNHLINNMRDREEERTNEPDNFDDQVLWFLMRQLRRGTRRSQSASANDTSSTSSSEESDEPDADELDQYPQSVQCRQS